MFSSRINPLRMMLNGGCNRCCSLVVVAGFVSVPLDVADRMTNAAMATTTTTTITAHCDARDVFVCRLLLRLFLPFCCFCKEEPSQASCSSHKARIRSNSLFASNTDSHNAWQLNWWLLLWASNSAFWTRRILSRFSRSSASFFCFSARRRSFSELRDDLKPASSFRERL